MGTRSGKGSKFVNMSWKSSKTFVVDYIVYNLEWEKNPHFIPPVSIKFPTQHITNIVFVGRRQTMQVLWFTMTEQCVLVLSLLQIHLLFSFLRCLIVTGLYWPSAATYRDHKIYKTIYPVVLWTRELSAGLGRSDLAFSFAGVCVWLYGRGVRVDMYGRAVRRSERAYRRHKYTTDNWMPDSVTKNNRYRSPPVTDKQSTSWVKLADISRLTRCVS